MSKAAMKLALEALQKIYIAPEHEEYIRVWWPACEQAITALQKALANEALERMAENARELGLDYESAQQTIHCKHRRENNGVCPHHNLHCGWPKCNEPEQPAQTATYTCGVCGVSMQMEQPAQQEPSELKIWKVRALQAERVVEKFMAQPQQEPVAWMQDSIELYVQDIPSATYTIPLYTSPPAQRDIRNATLDEIAGKIEKMPFGDTAASFAVWIREQKQ